MALALATAWPGLSHRSSVIRSRTCDPYSFGNPADSVSPVALRPRLATGVLFRGFDLPLRRPRCRCPIVNVRVGNGYEEMVPAALRRVAPCRRLRCCRLVG